jgi:hypothetical protein
VSGVNITGLEDAFMAWVKSKALSPWVCVWAEQNAPKPGPKQITVNRGQPFIIKVGDDLSGSVDIGTGARKRLGTRELAFSLRAYGPGAAQILEDVRSAFDDESANDLLLASALCAVASGPVTDISAIYGSQHKEVANVDFRLRTHSLREGADAEAGVGYITTVQMDIDTVDPGGNTTTEEIQVGPVP